MPTQNALVRKDSPVATSDKRRPTTLEQACGQVIALYREQMGLSQKDLAAATGYSLRYVGDIERGNKSATLRTLSDIASPLSLHVGTLITEAEGLLGGKERQGKTPPLSKGKPVRSA